MHGTGKTCKRFAVKNFATKVKNAEQANMQQARLCSIEA